MPKASLWENSTPREINLTKTSLKTMIKFENKGIYNVNPEYRILYFVWGTSLDFNS